MVWNDREEAPGGGPRSWCWGWPPRARFPPPHRWPTRRASKAWRRARCANCSSPCPNVYANRTNRPQAPCTSAGGPRAISNASRTPSIPGGTTAPRDRGAHRRPAHHRNLSADPPPVVLGTIRCAPRRSRRRAKLPAPEAATGRRPRWRRHSRGQRADFEPPRARLPEATDCPAGCCRRSCRAPVPLPTTSIRPRAVYGEPRHEGLNIRPAADRLAGRRASPMTSARWANCTRLRHGPAFHGDGGTARGDRRGGAPPFAWP